MQIIRDEELGGIAMIPLFVQWGIRRCNVEDCTEIPNTIIREIAPGVAFAGFCEEHFQEGNQPGGISMSLVFDDFDAFETRRAAAEAQRGTRVNEQLARGTQILYVPTHADGDTKHADCEAGFVWGRWEDGGCGVYCRYWNKHSLGELRTGAGSELTPRALLVVLDTVPQGQVNAALQKIEGEVMSDG